MPETPIADAVENALSGALAEQGAMLTGFVCLAATINGDGCPGLTVTRPDGQAVHVALGLVAYATEWFRDDVRYQINQLCEEDE